MQLSAITASLWRFFGELQRRKVLRVAATYLVGAWVVLQVAVALQTAWALSAAFSGTILNLMIIGFPLAVGLTWFFEITPQGVRRTSVSGDGAIAKLQTPDFVLAGALALVFSIGVAQFFWPREAAKLGAPRLGDKSIAVLPFKNLSSSKDDAFFAQGLTEETLNALTRVRQLKVTSRTSSETFAGKDTPLPEIAQPLGVRYILEGSVRREGDFARVTAQLIDVPSDTHVWSKTFQPKLDEVFAVQDDIATAIAQALDLELKLSEGAPKPLTSNIEAYRLFLEATARFNVGGGVAVSEGVALAKRAIALDPNFAAPYTMVAMGAMARAIPDPAARKTALVKAKAAIASAAKIDPDLVGLRGPRATIAFYELRWEDAFREAKPLMESGDLRSFGCMLLASFNRAVGEFTSAASLYEEGQSLAPFDRSFNLSKMMLAFDQGDDEQVDAMAHLMTWASKDIAPYGNLLLAIIAVDKGDRFGASEHFKRALMKMGTHRDIVAPVYLALRGQGSIAEAVSALRAEAVKDPHFDIQLFLFLIDPANAWVDEMNARIARGDTLSVAFWLGNVWRLVAHGEGNNPKVKSLMRSTGLVDYWKKHGWPDRCRAKGEDDFECS